MLASREHAQSPDDCGCSTHYGAKREALDLPPRWFGLYSAWTPRQFHHSAPRKHGCTDHCLVCTPWRIVVLLRFDGDHWFGDRRLRYIPACSQRWEGNARTQVPAQEARKDLQDLRSMGFWRNRHPRLAAAPAPMVPFLLAAGAMQYSVNKFLVALTLGRIVRYSILAYLAARYGRHMLTSISQLRHPILIVAIALIATAVVVLVVILGSKRKRVEIGNPPLNPDGA